MSAVSDMVHYPWDKVFGMSILEFLTFLKYVNFTRKREEARIKKMMKK